MVCSLRKATGRIGVTVGGTKSGQWSFQYLINRGSFPSGKMASNYSADCNHNSFIATYKANILDLLRCIINLCQFNLTIG